MQAGDDILVNANITTNNGAITLTANDPGGSEANTGLFGEIAWLAPGAVLFLEGGDEFFDERSTDRPVVERVREHVVTQGTTSVQVHVDHAGVVALGHLPYEIGSTSPRRHV